MISVTVSGLNAPIKRYRATECKKERKKDSKKQAPYISWIQRVLTSVLKTQTESEKMEKSIPCNGNKKKTRVVTQQTTKNSKTDLKLETVVRDKEGYYMMIPNKDK